MNLTDSQREALDIVRKHGGAATYDQLKTAGVDARNCRRIMQRLVDDGLLEATAWGERFGKPNAWRLRPLEVSTAPLDAPEPIAVNYDVFTAIANAARAVDANRAEVASLLGWYAGAECAVYPVDVDLFSAFDLASMGFALKACGDGAYRVVAVEDSAPAEIRDAAEVDLVITSKPDTVVGFSEEPTRDAAMLGDATIEVESGPAAQTTNARRFVESYMLAAEGSDRRARLSAADRFAILNIANGCGDFPEDPAKRASVEIEAHIRNSTTARILLAALTIRQMIIAKLDNIDPFLPADVRRARGRGCVELAGSPRVPYIVIKGSDQDVEVHADRHAFVVRSAGEHIGSEIDIVEAIAMAVDALEVQPVEQPAEKPEPVEEPPATVEKWPRYLVFKHAKLFLLNLLDGSWDADDLQAAAVAALDCAESTASTQLARLVSAKWADRSDENVITITDAGRGVAAFCAENTRAPRQRRSRRASKPKSRSQRQKFADVCELLGVDWQTDPRFGPVADTDCRNVLSDRLDAYLKALREAAGVEA